MGRETHGFVTPRQDLTPQRFSVPPRRVIPIIFIPGIMGSNLRLTPARQAQLNRNNNIAWRPDFKTFAASMAKAGAAERQALLNARTTEVDIYDPDSNPTGDPNETADERNSKVDVDLDYVTKIGIDTPLLCDDPPTHPRPRTRNQKARMRGWGEVFYSSYSTLLELCEEKLNSAYRNGRLDEWWRNLINIPPKKWNAHSTPHLDPLDEAVLKKALQGCWFPLHAMGYNWLESNEISGKNTATRIKKLLLDYQLQGYECQKVILVTHSMGGLVARAVAHPLMGNLQDCILGVVHGVMPAIGAAATYKRMRCGFEGPTSAVLGSNGPNVTAVLANAQGGLELLPTSTYGNAWLNIRQNFGTLLDLPQAGNPYDEIYKIQNRWYRLLIAEWINPAGDRFSGLDRTFRFLDLAKSFHDRLDSFYHPQNYAHYGADKAHQAWQSVTWDVFSSGIRNVQDAQIISDTATGSLWLVDRSAHETAPNAVKRSRVTLLPPKDAGDETVPAFSADAQLRSGKFKGIFRQTGYEHQSSYKDESALHSTVYCIVRIAETMTWEPACVAL